MGATHFRQMQKDAIETDRRATPIALLLASYTREEANSELGSFWDNSRVDVLFDMARKLVPLSNWFSAQLKDMLLKGTIVVMVQDTKGKVHHVRDTRVMDFDDPEITLEELFEWMQHPFPGEIQAED